jgi:hypothetical protein
MAALPNPFDSASIVERSAEVPAVASVVAPSDVAAECFIGEIFVGARKLDQLPGIFDPAAITGTDELLYVTLKLQDEPGTRDLPCIPDEQAFMEAIEPMPLFLRQAV